MKNTHAEQILDMIMLSDLSPAAKIYALEKLAVDAPWQTSSTAQQQAIGYLLDLMPQNGEGIRVKDLIEQNNLPFSVQKLSSILRSAKYYGRVNRTTINTGRKIVVQYGYYEYGKNYRPIWVEKEKEIDEVIALYSVRK